MNSTAILLIVILVLLSESLSFILNVNSEKTLLLIMLGFIVMSELKTEEKLDSLIKKYETIKATK